MAKLFEKPEGKITRMLKFKKRDAQMPSSINVRGEFHGDTAKAAIDIKISFNVDRSEFSDILRRPEAWMDYFEEKGNLFEPKYAGITDGIYVEGKFEKSKCKFRLGVNFEEVDIEDATVSKIKLEPQVGGMSLCTLTISALQTDEMKSLQDHFGLKCKIDLSIGKLKEQPKDDQGKLPLGEGSPTTPPDTKDEALAQDEADQQLAEQQQAEKPKRVRDRSKEKKRNREEK